MADRSFLDWPFLDEGHKALAYDLDAWAEREIAELAHAESDVDETCRELVAKLAEGGWLRYAVPASHGGLRDKLDVRSLCLIRETLARHGGLADFAFAMQGLGSGPISLFGTDDQKQAYLPAVAQGEKIAAFALSEPEAGSDVAALATTAERDSDHFILNGLKTWISNGGIADFYVVFARTGEAAGAKGLSAFIVDADTPGLTVEERIEVVAPHPLATLKFENCRVPASAQLGAGGAGFKIAMATLDVFRSTVGAASLGFARRALDEALERCSTRELFGAPLADLQMTQASLADMATDVDASALMIYRAAWTKDLVADRVTREAAMAKLYATEAAQRVIDKGVQLFGGHGVTVGNVMEKLYREVRALRIYEGASEVQKVIIARQALTLHAAARND
ncbi:acyl-CoA dehydrogenase family protein [Aestuariispira ectoiniformans]|uniref:acyl-CoA dehydrogenase family protein n=1 Tax=Aestuariispira ectoiniformans TaxID=2775080 RepID=UPI00223A803F|nr:acyl-CoA dehydrogenase family protein [Aestuariispira ectoiniformans]